MLTMESPIANLFQCLPIATNWIGLGATPEACIDTNPMYIGQAWSDIFTDGSEPNRRI